MKQNSEIQMPIPKVELYDLILDPNETNNVAEDFHYEKVRKEMHARLIRWMEKTDDPVLQNKMPEPFSGIRDQ